MPSDRVVGASSTRRGTGPEAVRSEASITKLGFPRTLFFPLFPFSLLFGTRRKWNGPVMMLLQIQWRRRWPYLCSWAWAQLVVAKANLATGPGVALALLHSPTPFSFGLETLNYRFRSIKGPPVFRHGVHTACVCVLSIVSGGASGRVSNLPLASFLPSLLRTRHALQPPPLASLVFPWLFVSLNFLPFPPTLKMIWGPREIHRALSI